jgi:hypothetical protein
MSVTLDITSDHDHGPFYRLYIARPFVYIFLRLELASLALNVMSLALRITVFPPFKIPVETTSWIQAST